jgi:hypothetical protein
LSQTMQVGRSVQGRDHHLPRPPGSSMIFPVSISSS